MGSEMAKLQKSAGLSLSTSSSVGEITKTGKSAVPALQLVTASRHPALPFLTHTRTKRGRAVSWCDFDVPAEHYAQGFSTGTKAFAAVFKVMHSGGGIDLVMICDAAGAALADKADGPSRRGAAAGFFRALEAVLKHAAGPATVSNSTQVVNMAVFYAERAAERWANELAAKAAKASKSRVRRSQASAGCAQ